MVRQITENIEMRTGDRVSDLHLWSVGPSIYALSLSVVSSEPKAPDAYKQLLPAEAGIVHATVEVHPRKTGGAPAVGGMLSDTKGG